VINKLIESTTLKLVVSALVALHVMLWFGKLGGGMAEYGVAVTGILYMWRDREKNKDV